jgi:hypothetical protein
MSVGMGGEVEGDGNGANAGVQDSSTLSSPPLSPLALGSVNFLDGILV